MGSWSSKLLWLPLGRRNAVQGSPGRCCTWMTLLCWAGWLVLAAAVPLPYYIRLVVFYTFEDDEMRDRSKAVDALGLRYGFDHDLFQWLTPTHGVVMLVYVFYAVSIVSLAVLRRTRAAGVDRLITQTFSDLRRLRPSLSVRLLLAHFLLPLEKFGLVCGVVVGLVYWPVTLPLCLAAVSCYMVPLVYVTGRLLINARCRCLSSLPLTTNHAQSGNLSEGVTSFEHCCFLDAISSSDDERVGRNDVCNGCVGVAGTLKSMVVGMMAVVLVWSILLMYAEAIGFVVEVLVMTSVGFILNSGSDAARRVVLVAWSVVYVVACYRAAVGKYVQFSAVVFAAMKRRLADRLLAAATLHHRRNIAFKYFTADEIRRTTTVHSDNIPTVMSTSLLSAVVDDSIEYQSNLLHWKISALSLFVDRKDTAHIPRHLFYRLCRMDVPGSPRSGLRVALTSLGRLVIAGLFLLVFGLVIELLADAETSDGGNATGQTLITFAYAALPLIIHAILTRLTARRRPGSELLDGKIEREVLSYVQSWPVFDLAFRQTGNNESMTSRPEVADDATELKAVSTHDNQLARDASRDNDSRDTSDSHVDLLITIRDDDNDEDGSNETGVKLRSGELATTDRESPVGLGTPCLDRQTPADGLATAPATPRTARTVRPRSVTIDEQNRAAAQPEFWKKDSVGFLLRKQNSASAIPLRHQVKEEEVSGGRTSSSTLVVDMSGDGDVTAVATSSVVGSTRPLTSHNDARDSLCESAL